MSTLTLQLPSLHTFFTAPAPLSSRMSLTLLPSTPAGYGPSPVYDQMPALPSPAKRPRLTLNTSNIDKGSTSLRLETLSATSPTARNTFQNRAAGDMTPSLPQKKPTLRPLVTEVQPAVANSPTPSQIPLPDSAETLCSKISPAAPVIPAPTLDTSAPQLPYTIPFNTTSILTNGPIPRTNSSRLSFSQSRPVFVPKKVGFRSQLTEEVKNVKFTLRHSDIEEIPTETSMSDVSHLGDEEHRQGQNKLAEADVEKKATISPQVNADGENRGYPATPVTGKAKRQNWVWTLEPIQPSAKLEHQ